ncbi:uncharacterized protein LOC116767620 isoform X4 [Danaus plexippus]|uniref:uncharacterized protein LOC116767620 isoform X4 n=1 Tax=Danaus plexippus TaxID=13037 RepID=UPI002AB2D0B1|nr:uncharacterized protein LOC116767620 isoform X4 [Danaus plexippus]
MFHSLNYRDSDRSGYYSKELLEKRIKQLEDQLEEEKRRTQRERMAVTKLQNKLIKREGAARNDADRERRARGDWEARARAAEADATRLTGKLHAAQREIARMEDTVRSLLQYKGRVETLKQEKASLSVALEASASHYQSQLSVLSAENERLREELTALSAGVRDSEHEKRLDDVAQQVVRALLSQKSVREELGCARARIRELEAQNRALSSLLVRQLRPQPRPSPATPLTPHTNRDLQVHLVDVGSCGSLVSFRDSPPPAPPAPQPHPLSQDDKRRHQILADIWTELKGLEVTPANLARALSAVDPTLWAPPARPATLSLSVLQPTEQTQSATRGKATEEETGEAGVESPESGAKDEGYSTMSSDVQADASRQSDHVGDPLPDLNEASDETDNQTIVSINPREPRRRARLIAEADYIYFPIGVAFAGIRGSYPPSRPVLPFQHVVRSFSDSHLCLKLLTSTSCPPSCLETPSPSSGILVLDLKPAPERPLRRPAVASTTSSERVSWGSTIDERADVSQYDADYVQHWLELDDARSALQQRHRDLADLEYDRAELEDWSLSLSCEDLRDRQSPFAEITTPGQISHSTLPSIREDDALELEEDVGDCLWNDCGFATVEIDECRIGDEVENSEKRWEYTGTHSPGGSWSSASDAPEKRSSTALSEDGDCANIGLDFTRDFYRLVKYESTKSLASNSSKGVTAQDPANHLRITDVQTVGLQDREQALQNVLNFIAEQQKYCRDREESDSMSSRPVSEIRELPPPYAAADFDDESVDPRSEISEDRQRPDSFGSFSENDSCDVIPLDRTRLPVCENISEPRSTPRFIEREDPYVESEDYYDRSRVENAENEIDAHHLLKVQRKNEINRNIDINNLADIEPPSSEKDDETCDNESSRTLEHNSALKDNTVNITSSKEGSSERETEASLAKSSSLHSAVESEISVVDETLTICRRTSLGTVPEEEESSSPETSSPQMTESNTTSTSTAETVIVSNKNESFNREVRRRNDKSRIPTLTGGKRPPSSPHKARSKIPVSDRGKPAQKQATPPPEPIIVKQENTLSFHEAATSKEVIEELNRMIRQSEGAATTTDVKTEEGQEKPYGQKDSALWAPTGWVHVEKDIDFSDPKARANLLDVMLASSDSSPSSCGSSPAEQPPYSRLHRLHRSRRQKTAAALRVRGLGALRHARHRRPSILGRDGFFVRYAEPEKAAVATFDFLDELSAGSSPDSKHK